MTPSIVAPRPVTMWRRARSLTSRTRGQVSGALVDVEIVAVVQVVVDHRRQEVVGGGDGVEVAGQVQVHPLGRQDAGAPGASGSALDAEGGAHGRLAQSQDCLLAQAGKPWASPMAVVVLPSPKGVGVIAVTTT